MPAATYNDGSKPYGSLSLSIPSVSGVSYIAENISVTQGTEKLTQKDALGVYSGGVFIPQEISGTATLQLPTTSSLLPVVSQIFVADLMKAGGTAPTWIVTEVGMKYGNSAIQMVDISFTQKVGA